MSLNIQKTLKTYYDELEAYRAQGATHENAIRVAFQNLLASWGRPRNLTVVAEKSLKTAKKTTIKMDGVLYDQFNFVRGYWEAKDTADKMDNEIAKKIAAGYPLDNTLFENSSLAVLYQGGREVLRVPNMGDATALRDLLDRFVGYQPARIEEFHKAVAEFRERIPQLAQNLTGLIADARKNNKVFNVALNDFWELCKSALNPNTTLEQVEDMLKQHLLTERVFRSIFQNPDFVQRNAVANQLEIVVSALTRQSFSRDEFFGSLNYFYQTIEDAARTVTDFSEKQTLLNTIYEQFFQAYSTKTADTHGIVYTPPEIVEFMVASVRQALETEFGEDISSEGVHIIDPCVGTGTFMTALLSQIPTSMLEQKYKHELHANEIQLLPYYIAALNIEHDYYERTGRYEPFAGICFADTLDTLEGQQMEMFAQENSLRIEEQKKAPIRVIIGNPPYNVGQENENDNNKNRRHPKVDKRISETYVKASKATLKTQLYDPYVKFFRWATDRLDNRDGVICFVSNNSFINQFTFDGMRKHLLEDFTRIYTFDLGGNVRKNPKL
jgi:predicted helicase